MEKNRRHRRQNCKICANCACVEKKAQNLCNTHNIHVTVKGCNRNEDIGYRVKNIYYLYFECLSIGKHAEIFNKNGLFFERYSLLT